MRYLGIDLAWGERARTGLAELDATGRLRRSASVRTDAEIVSFVGDDAGATGLVAAIDAPLVVPNEAGQRPCEHEIGRLFGGYDAGAYPANRGNPAFLPEPRGARLADRLGWDMDPSHRPGSGGAVAIEVYPHPAMVSLFGLDRVIPYKGKKGRDVPSRQEAFAALFDGMDRICGPLLDLPSSDRWRHLRSIVADRPRHVDLDTVEDEVDAIFCAYLAWMWHHEPERMVVVGDVTTGYIVTPPPPSAATPAPSAPERVRLFVDADLAGARFIRTDLSGAVMRGVDVRGLDIDAPWLGEGDTALLVNGVEVAPLVEAELDRRFPGRSLRRAEDADGLRAAWAAVERTWSATVDRVATMGEAAAGLSVDDEWSFAQTLRHLVMATDVWLRRAVLDVPDPYHPLGQPHAEFATDGYDLSVFSTREPSYAEVLDARAGRQAMVREFLTTVTDEGLRAPQRDPWDPTGEVSTLDCLHVILHEEWEHHRFAVRDLAVLARLTHT